MMVFSISPCTSCSGHSLCSWIWEQRRPDSSMLYRLVDSYTSAEFKRVVILSTIKGLLLHVGLIGFISTFVQPQGPPCRGTWCAEMWLVDWNTTVLLGLSTCLGWSLSWCMALSRWNEHKDCYKGAGPSLMDLLFIHTSYHLAIVHSQCVLKMPYSTKDSLELLICTWPPPHKDIPTDLVLSRSAKTCPSSHS